MRREIFHVTNELNKISILQINIHLYDEDATIPILISNQTMGDKDVIVLSSDDDEQVADNLPRKVMYF